MQRYKKKAKAQEKTGARERVSPSRAPVLSFTHYFQAPATQVNVKTKGISLENITWSELGNKTFKLKTSIAQISITTVTIISSFKIVLPQSTSATL